MTYKGLPAGVAGFFDRLPDLFRQANQKQWEVYEETIYSMERPVTHGNYHGVRRFIGGYNPPKQALADHRVHRELDSVLRSAIYPDGDVIGVLEPFTDGSAEFASALLHFNNPAYPIYDAPSVGGLQAIGYDQVEYVSTIEGDTGPEFQKYVDAIQELKDVAPYQAVPEKPYYLTRIIQEGLWTIGVENPAEESTDRPKPTLR